MHEELDDTQQKVRAAKRGGKVVYRSCRDTYNGYINEVQKGCVSLTGRQEVGGVGSRGDSSSASPAPAWGLHGPEAFGFGFEAWAQEEGEASSPGAPLVKEFDGKGDQLTGTFDAEAGFFRVT